MIQLRHPVQAQEPTFVPFPSRRAVAARTQPRRRCETCPAWLSIYRHYSETRCVACQRRHGPCAEDDT